MYKGYEPADDPIPCDDLSDLNHVSESSLLIRHCVYGEKPFQPVTLQLVAEYCVEASLSVAHAHEVLSRLTRAGLVSGAFTVEGVVEAVARANGTLPPKGIVVLERLLERMPKQEEPTLTDTPAPLVPVVEHVEDDRPKGEFKRGKGKGNTYKAGVRDDNAGLQGRTPTIIISPSPQNWAEVAIWPHNSRRDGALVRVVGGTRTGTFYTAAQFGLVTQTGNESRLWGVFLQALETPKQEGDRLCASISYKPGTSQSKTRRHVSDLRKALKNAFGIAANPFPTSVTGKDSLYEGTWLSRFSTIDD